jgi:hypothetical protein
MVDAGATVLVAPDEDGRLTITSLLASSTSAVDSSCASSDDRVPAAVAAAAAIVPVNAVASADLDGDDHIDVVLLSANGGVTVLLDTSFSGAFFLTQAR